MKVIIAGGSGHLGTLLSESFHASGDEVVVLSRRPELTPWRSVLWDGRTFGDWTEELEGAGAVINLAGRSVDCRYTRANRQEIFRSRVDSTRILGKAIAAAAVPPPVWIQSSTATIYAHRYDAPNDEVTGILGGDEPDAPSTWRFSIDVAQAWEHECHAATTPRTRRVLTRTAMVMAPGRGGPFHALLRHVRLGLGGRVGDGRQWMSWIHGEDFVRAIRFLIRREDLEGAVNVAAPEPLPNVDFMRALTEAAGVRVALPSPRWMLELGAFVIRTETELLLKSRRVVPTRLLAGGFSFRHPTWIEAAHDLVARGKEGRLACAPESSPRW